MARNYVRKYRKTANLTQAQLAKLVGTSQQQVHRIEGGAQTVRLDLAIQICTALRATMEEVFPHIAKPLATAAKRAGLDQRDPLIKVYRDRKAVEELEAAGLDMDVEDWTFRVELRNGYADDFPISGPDMQKLWLDVQSEEKGVFLVFDSLGHRYAINRDHLVYCHFRFDPPGTTIYNEDENIDDPTNVLVYLASRKDPLPFHVDVDEDPPTDPADPDDEGQMRGVLYDLWFMHQAGNDCRDVHFEDVDGETAFFRSNDVAMLQVSLKVIQPQLMLEDDDEVDVSRDDVVAAATAVTENVIVMPSARSQLTDEEKTELRNLLRALEPFRQIRHTMPLQYVISYLLVALNEGKGVTEYAQRLGVSNSVMSRHLLDIGERNRQMDEGFGLVQFRPNPIELRKHEYTLTDKGQALARQMIHHLKPGTA